MGISSILQHSILSSNYILHSDLYSGQQSYDSYITFYNALLTHVYESLLSVHRIPLFSFLWPLLRQLEAQVRKLLYIVEPHSKYKGSLALTLHISMHY